VKLLVKQRPKGRVVKCPQCNEYEIFADRLKMKIFEKGSRKFYLHDDCYEKFVHQKEMQEKENIEKGKLYEFIKKIHDKKIIPNSFWFRIEDLRNGNFNKFTKMTRVNKKEGFTYPVIYKAYDLAKEQIRKTKGKINFQSDFSEFYYCLKIVENYLLKAEKLDKKEKREKIRLEGNKNIQHLSLTEKQKTEYQKRTYEDDILDLMD
jgi:hypothetical protein